MNAQLEGSQAEATHSDIATLNNPACRRCNPDEVEPQVSYILTDVFASIIAVSQSQTKSKT